MRPTSRKLNLSVPTILKYFHLDDDETPGDREAFETLVGRAKERRVQEWLALASALRSTVARDLPSIEATNANDIKSLVTSAAIATDKVQLIEMKMPGQQAPLSLSLLINGDIDARQIQISEKELELLAEARVRRSGGVAAPGGQATKPDVSP